MAPIAGMKLFHRSFGTPSNPPLMLLHGLLGSSRNWVSAAHRLAQSFHVLALDLRNHGSSFHNDHMDYEVLSTDVMNWMDANSLASAFVAGHSMGGKVAMRLACTQSHRVERLCVIDITPRPYASHLDKEFNAMLQLDPSLFTRISDAEAALQTHLSDPDMRQFLVTNLKRNEAGSFSWQINLQSIYDSQPALLDTPLDNTMGYEGPTLLIHGGRSDFVQETDFALFKAHFPDFHSHEIPDAGHNPHVQKKDACCNLIEHFFSNEPPQA